VSCGAPVEPTPGPTTRCPYCDRVLIVAGTSVRAEEGAGRRTPTDALLSGYREDVGVGQRYSVAEAGTRDWPARATGLWPVRAAASSTFGGGWSVEAIVGAPSVFPRTGDIRGAWAPRPRTSHVEWIQASYPDGAPPVGLVRVFETCAAGAVFAVTAIERGREDLGETCLWQRRPAPVPGSWMLEVPLDPPRHLASVRVYLSNDSSRWSEIDTIGLVAVAPVPEELRRAPRAVPAAHLRPWVVAAVIGAVVIGMAIWMVKARNPKPVARAPLPAARAAAPLTVPVVPLPEPAARVPGVTAATSTPSGQELQAVVWAAAAPRASSEYSPTRWSRHQVVGPPDVYPTHGDQAAAWATREQSRGEEWLEVSFATPLIASAVVIVETYNPGAVVRVDDLTDPIRPAVLWAGTTPAVRTSRVLRLELPAPRRLGTVRVVLDTTRASTWNEIDAVGLQPAP
jgi:hypothetical protein